MSTVVIFGGPGGSGRSTVAKQFAEINYLDHVYGGLRKIAKEILNHPEDIPLSEAEFVEFQHNHVPAHPEIDLLTDAELLRRAGEGDVVIESMTLGPITKRLNLPYLRVWVEAKEDVRLNRILKRDQAKGIDVTFEQIQEIQNKREEQNKVRFMALYGFNFLDTSFYDLVFDTSNLKEMAMAQELITRLTEKGLWHAED